MENLWGVLFRNGFDEVKIKQISSLSILRTQGRFVWKGLYSTLVLKSFFSPYVENEWDLYTQNPTFPSTSFEFQFRTDIIFHLMCFTFLMSHDVNNEKCLKMKDDIKEAVWGTGGQCSEMILVQLLETY